MHERLKPCPHCGSHEVALRWIGEMARVYCDKCGACGGFGNRPNEARELWNRRAEADE